MPTRELPENPNLEHLKNEAKALQRRVRSGDGGALDLVREFHPRRSVPSGLELSGFTRGPIPIRWTPRTKATPLGWAEHNQQQHIVDYLAACRTPD